MNKDTPKRPRKKFIAPKVCFFCKEKKDPSFHEVETLRRFLTEREKILARARTGVCAKHQNKLTTTIKHARHLALLPFIPQS